MIAAIGTFDGFHAGHRVLLEETGRLAHRNKTNWGVVTFSPHPDVYFGNVSKLLFSEYEKNAAAKFLKVPEVIKLPFGEICGMGPEDFLAMLAKEYSISGIAVGEDFRFGADARGDAALIKKFCADNALPCSVIETVNYPEGPEAGKKISARVLREWLKNGNAGMLRGALKYPCPLSGIVVRGDGRGTKLGFPTVNISADAEKMLPADGVYAVSVLMGSGWRAGAMFAGVPPTFKDAGEARVEAHISGFSGDLYGQRVTVFLEDFLRPPMMFKDEVELARDIKLCVEKAGRIFETNRGLDAGLYGELLNAFSEGERPVSRGPCITLD